MTEQDIIDAAEYADIRWSGADVPLGWLRHFVDALGKPPSLPEPKQEPVRREQKMFMDEQEFYTAPPQRKLTPEQEPVVWMYQNKSTHEVRFQKHMSAFVDHGATYETPLYTAPPQRAWKWLTDIDYAGLTREQVGIVRWAETKLKEKNK